MNLKIIVFILYISILLLIIGILLLSNKESYSDNSIFDNNNIKHFINHSQNQLVNKSVPTKIDIVYTWVENSQEFSKEKDMWFTKEKEKKYDTPSDIRYQDHKELLYSLRSLEKYFPYFNNIYLVVKDGQFPSYLKKNNPRLIIVNHSDIIPKEYLPTFNSRSIETYLHHIPNLSEYYLYLNDDVMFLKPTNISYFVNDNGIPYTIHNTSKINKKPISSLNLNSNSFKCGLQFNSAILDDITKNEDRYEISHSPMSYRKSYDFEIEKFFKKYHYGNDKDNLFDKTGAAKFRRCDDLYFVSLIKPYLYKNLFHSTQKPSESIFVVDFNTNKKLNSHFLHMEFVVDFNSYIKYMDNLYQQKSQFEK